MNVQDIEIKDLLLNYKKYTVYGLSPNTEKPSHYVPQYMRENGWEMVGTYPKHHNQSDFSIVNSLKEVPKEYRKFINVFRASEKIPDVYEEILEIDGVEVLWLQLGIKHPEIEAKAEAAGLKVVSDRCLIIEHKKWFT